MDIIGRFRKFMKLWMLHLIEIKEPFLATVNKKLNVNLVLMAKKIAKIKNSIIKFK